VWSLEGAPWVRATAATHTMARSRVRASSDEYLLIFVSNKWLRPYSPEGQRKPFKASRPGRCPGARPCAAGRKRQRRATTLSPALETRVTALVPGRVQRPVSTIVARSLGRRPQPNIQELKGPQSIIDHGCPLRRKRECLIIKILASQGSDRARSRGGGEVREDVD